MEELGISISFCDPLDSGSLFLECFLCVDDIMQILLQIYFLYRMKVIPTIFINPSLDLFELLFNMRFLREDVPKSEFILAFLIRP